MPDPDTVAIPVLAGAALAQGITFLYGQAAEVLRIRREGRLAHRTTLTVRAPFEPSDLVVALDPNVLESRAGELEALLDIAKHFTAQKAEQLDGSDLALRTCFGRLRNVLEAVYDTRLAFAGEPQPEPRVRQTIDDVHGSATGMKYRGTSNAATGEVIQRVRTVHRDGEVTGFDIDLRG
jgi:hypothetical protein